MEIYKENKLKIFSSIFNKSISNLKPWLYFGRGKIAFIGFALWNIDIISINLKIIFILFDK